MSLKGSVSVEVWGVLSFIEERNRVEVFPLSKHASWSLIYLLYQTHLALFLDFFFHLLRLLLFNLDLNLLPEHLSQLYTLILIIRSLQSLADLPVLIPLEYLLHLLPCHPWVLVNQQCSRLALQVSHLLVDFVEFSRD